MEQFAIAAHIRPSLTALTVALTLVLLFLAVAIFYPSEDITPLPIYPAIPAELDPSFNFTYGETKDPEVRDGKIWPKCPADGRRLSAEPIIPATIDTIDRAIQAATKAQQSWARTTFVQRKRVLNTILKYIIDHQEDIVQACCLDSGKTKIDACFGEILVTVEKLQWTIKHGQRALAPSRRGTNLLMAYKSNTVIYEPLGVVAACFSWNYPFHSWISSVISAIFSGNGIVLKPSEQTCWSSHYFQDIVSAALTACGHDADLVQTVVCLPDTADYLTSHSDIKHITFIGSRPVALKVCASAAKALTPVCVELGGKDPAIVLDDAATIKDLDSIVAIIMRGTFQSAGQNCIGIERIIALPSVYDLLIPKLHEKIKSIRMGSITLHATGDKDIDMGSMISPASFDRLENLIAEAQRLGATLHIGGSRYEHSNHPCGHYFSPTLLSGVTANVPLAQQELFAPVCVVMKAHTIEEAIQLANSTSYGLGASVFGAATATNTPLLKKIAHRVRSGMVSINDFGAYYACSMPFGGTNDSGYGRFGGSEGLQALCNVKSICEDTWWARMLSIKTEIPPVLQYPVQGQRGWEACKGIIKTGYGISFPERARGVVQLLRALMFGGSRTCKE